jgi:ABC-2 type transport system permease protein
MVVFRTPMAGSHLLLFTLALLFITTVVGWGLVLSAISHTQQQAILFVFIFAMVEVTFSGYIVSLDNMPAFLQTISRIVSLQHFLVIVRSVMLKGANLAELLPNVLALVILCVGFWTLALRSIARSLE